MKIQIFSIYDSKAKVFSQAFFSPNIAVALRSFSVAVNDRETQLFKHPEDFSVFHIGEFDDDTGLLVPLLPVVSLGLAANFKGV